MEIKENIPLKEFSYFKIGGCAKYFCIIESIKDLSEALNFSKEKNLEIFILGNGSNILISDKGFNGLVIKNEIKFIETIENENDWLLEVGSGVLLPELFSFCLKKSLSGLEKLFGIPATIGGMIYENAGAHGCSIGDLTEKVKVLNLEKNKIEELSKEKLAFRYRASIFHKKHKYIILSVFLRLIKDENSRIKQRISEIIQVRIQNQPLSHPSAGSIFKNISVNKFSKDVLEKEALIVSKNMISSGYLIDKMNLKGEAIADAQISEKHAGFIINLGNARADDVKSLIDLIKQKALKRFGVEMQEEIEYVGDFS